MSNGTKLLDLTLDKAGDPIILFQRGREAHSNLLDLTLGKTDDSSWAIIVLSTGEGRSYQIAGLDTG